jgi:hypothetical protein
MFRFRLYALQQVTNEFRSSVDLLPLGLGRSRETGTFVFVCSCRELVGPPARSAISLLAISSIRIMMVDGTCSYICMSKKTSKREEG